jgi:hypothetical protein
MGVKSMTTESERTDTLIGVAFQTLKLLDIRLDELQSLPVDYTEMTKDQKNEYDMLREAFSRIQENIGLAIKRKDD